MRSANRMVSAIASGMIAKQPRHFVRRLEMAFGIGFEPLADGLDGGLLADAGQDILQRTPRGIVIQHVVGGEQRHARLSRAMRCSRARRRLSSPR